MPSRRPKRTIRFAFIVLLAGLATVLAAAGGWRYARASAPVNGPIILISIDALRADHLPAYGYRKLETPAIDALAADGAVFERAYSHAPQTLPAHTSLLTGRLPFETGVRDDMGFTVKPGERLLPQMLRERGYATGAVVSSFLLRKETGIAQGFDFFDSDLTAGSPELAAGPLQRDGAESELIAERWLEQQRSPRVFLFLHLNEPHKPYSPPPQYGEYQAYDGEIAYADEIVGRLVRFLKSHQLYDRSTIILLSDHGESLGDHGEQEHGLFLYEETTHIPLIVKQAAGAGSGRRVPDLVQHIDLVPTILDFAKAPGAANLRGRSLKPVLDGSGTLEKRPVYAESWYGRYRFGWSEVFAVRTEKYRYVKSSRDELYDLENDPREQTDIAADREPAVERLRATLRAWTANASANSANVSEAERERFEAVGVAGVHLDWKAPSLDPAPAPADQASLFDIYRQAGDLTAAGHPGRAADLLKRAANDNPDMPDVWQELGHALERSGQPERAARALEKSASLASGNPAGLIAASRLLTKLGRLDEAQRDAEKAVDLATRSYGSSMGTAEQALALIAFARKDFDAARTHAANAQSSEPSVPHVEFVEGLVALHETKYDDALLHFNKASNAIASAGPFISELHFSSGQALERLDRSSEAVEEFEREIALFPRNLRARASLAVALKTTGQDEAAERALAELTSIAPTPEGYGIAARAWTAIGDARRAEALRSEGRRRFRGDPTVKLLAQSDSEGSRD